ncbi:MAG: LCP family protein [Kutzneria sp.]|nr:LCP family protein [Kutzneria sp.]
MAGLRGALRAAAKGTVGMLATATLASTCYGWVTVTLAEAGVAKVDVIDSGQKGPGADMNILLVGLDSRTDAHGDELPESLLAPLHAGGDQGELDTDTMIIMHVPGNGAVASAFSIPRDSYVTIAGQEGKHKINSAFQYGMNARITKLQQQGVTDKARLRSEGMDAGRKNLVQTIQNFTGVSIDHYAEVNLYGFAKISDAIGGVPVCLKYDTSDLKFTGATFKAGKQTVQGVAALQFVRQRHGPGLLNELDRERRQQVFLASMAHQMLASGILASPAKLREVVTAVQDAIVLDRSWDLLQFATQMRGLTGGNLTFNVMPVINVDGMLSDGDSVVYVNPSDVRVWAKSLFAAADQASAGEHPPSTSTPTAALTVTPTSIPGSASTVVDVSNGGAVAGLAGRVLDTLGVQGYQKGIAGTVSPRPLSVVEYGPGGTDAAQRVAGALGDLPVAYAPTVQRGHVLVLLGRAYHGPGSTPSDQGDVAGSGTTSTPTTTVTPDRPQIDAGTVPCVA